MAAVLAIAATLLGPLVPPVARAAGAQASAVLDVIDFGDSSSEAAHNLTAPDTSVVAGANGQSARVSNPLTPRKNYDGDLTFLLKVDPSLQNYLSIKLWGEDSSAYKTVVFINNEQVEYRQNGDYESINIGTLGGLKNRFLFNTAMLPLSSTQGQSAVLVTLRTYSGLDPSAPADQPSRPIYSAFTHTSPTVTLDASDRTSYQPSTEVAPAVTDQQAQGYIDSYVASQVKLFNDLSAKSDASAGGKMAIERYNEELRFYAQSLAASWSPAKTDADKRAALDRIFKSIDNYTKDYYGNVRSLGSGGHQSDWGGYYSILGEVLYVVENYISNDKIYGEKAFKEFLAQPFTTGTIDGDNSIAGVGWDGGQLTRGQAWERILKASYDFSRSRLSYIYNQMLYTYEGAWRASEGLRVIGSKFYPGKARSQDILLEATGVRPFLGEEVLSGPNGEDLDIYHSLFQHDQNVAYTPDTLQVVMKGLAKSKVDRVGNVIRRKPYGTDYTGITAAGLTRENGYVGGYGEAANDIANYFWETIGHTGDEELNAQLLKLSLKSIHARGEARYPGEDANGDRAMFEQNVVDDRTTAYPGRVAYGTEAQKGVALKFAGLEQYMADNSELYGGPEWKIYWGYAREAVGFAQQQLVDNQYFNTFNQWVLTQNKYDFRLGEEYSYITANRAGYTRFGQVAAGVVLPHTNLAQYSDAELAKLGIDRTTYKNTQFAWVDIDNLLVSGRDGDTHFYGSLAERNRGFTGVGHVDLQYGDYEQFAQVATEGILDSQSYVLRAPSKEDPAIFDRYESADDRPFGLAGELAPVAYQPGVGTISRDNWNEDNPYSGYPNLATTRYGKYFVAVNTTRSAYKNARAYTVKLPDGFSGSTVADLVSGKQVKVSHGSISIPAYSAVVLNLGTDVVEPSVPNRVDVVATTPGNGAVGLTWRNAAGATSYIVTRSSKPNDKGQIIAQSVRGTSFLDRTAPRGTSYYSVIATNQVGSSDSSSPSKAVVTASRTSSLASSGWRDDLIGSASSGRAIVTGSTVTLKDANGTGFGAGDDSVLPDRFKPDSTYMTTRLVQGDAVVSANLSQLGSNDGGIIVRDSTDPVGRYVYLGAGANGQIVFATRSIDTRADIGTGKPGDNAGGGYTRSPLTESVDGYSVKNYPYVQLIHHADSQSFVALVSKDGQSWTRVASAAIPMLDTANYGVTAQKAGTFTKVSITPLAAGTVTPTVAQSADKATVQWNKPTAAIAFDVYRTEDDKVAKTDPRSAQGWTKVMNNRFALSLTDTMQAAEAYYKVVSRFVDGSTQVGPSSGPVFGESLDQIIVRAKALKSDDYDRGSFYVLQQELARIEAATSKPDADIAQLRMELYAAIGQLAPRSDEVKLDTLGDATITTSHPEFGNGGRPINEVGKLIFDGSTGTSITLASPDNSWITAEFPAPVLVSKVRAYPQAARPDTIARMNNATILGSNDGSTWSEVGTFTGVTDAKWYDIVPATQTAYKFLRYAGVNGSWSSVAEVEYYKTVVDRSLVDVLVKQAASLDETKYSADSWAALQAALAEVASIDSTTNQVAVDAIAEDIRQAIGGLKPAGN
ncbi:hypothetical protein ACQPYH_29025 [Kribbella sp. CA-245084]|uniref:galactose-binding domain-containing protein n=1 Tax=Kribbella sp. CA-245084 TaxID=3239940 RepID=UPI003D8C3523